MLRWADRQREFSTVLLDPASGEPPGLTGPDGKPSAKRFAVYRNNVVAGLIATLKDAFPAVCRIVGDEFFQAMAREYVLSAPPRSPIMLEYGAGFPDFVRAFPPAAALSYLPDVARIEQAWREAYHAPDAVPLGTAAFARIAPDRRPHIRIRLHPSVRMVRSRLPALTIWRMNVESGVPGPVDLEGGGEDALVVRPVAEVEVRSMPPGGADFAAALAEKKSVLDAAKAGWEADCRFDLSANLAGLIGAGSLVALRLSAEPECPAAEAS